MKEFILNLRNRNSSILIKKGLVSRFGEIVFNKFGKKRIFIITDSTVKRLYGPKIQENLSSLHDRVEIISVEAGEKSKNFEMAGKLCNQMLELGMRRGDLIVALGGGVIGDLAGFVASILFRGVQYIQLPTTLLAQVDSSVGGKVGVDTARGKNLIGNFYQPDLVVIDPDFLKTLEPIHIYNGMAEVIKYGVIFDAAFFDFLLNIPSDRLSTYYEEIVALCVEYKIRVVEIDEFDKNERMVLNFGHTLGHALERFYDYEGLLHGEAVSIGMVWAAKMSHTLGMITQEEVTKIETTLQKYMLPTRLTVDFELLKPLMEQDKKNLNDKVTLILLAKIGEAKRCEIATL